jgi:HSP20 family protein
MQLIPYKNRALVTPERFLKSFFGNDLLDMESFYNTQENSIQVPRVNVVEKKDKYLITCEVPGVKKDDLDIQIDDNLLTICGSFKKEGKKDDESIIHEEFSYGTFKRSFSLNTEVDDIKTEAELKDGILHLVLHKKPAEKAKKKKILIK